MDGCRQIDRPLTPADATADLAARSARRTATPMAVLGGRRPDGGDLSAPNDHAAGLRRRIALGHCGRRDDRQRRLDCPTSTGTSICRTTAAGKLGDGRRRLGSRRGRPGGDSPTQCPGRHALCRPDLRLRPFVPGAAGAAVAGAGLCHGRPGAADWAAGRIRGAVHPAGGRFAVGLARRLHARLAAAGGVVRRLRSGRTGGADQGPASRPSISWPSTIVFLAWQRATGSGCSAGNIWWALRRW